jgi:hypothetical protein
LFGGSNIKLGTQHIFEPTIGSKSFHKTSNDNGVAVVNLVTQQNLSRAQSRRIGWTEINGAHQLLIYTDKLIYCEIHSV